MDFLLIAQSKYCSSSGHSCEREVEDTEDVVVCTISVILVVGSVTKEVEEEEDVCNVVPS